MIRRDRVGFAIASALLADDGVDPQALVQSDASGPYLDMGSQAALLARLRARIAREADLAAAATGEAPEEA